MDILDELGKLINKLQSVDEISSVIGNISALSTKEKSNLVLAINELNEKSKNTSTGYDDEKLKSILSTLDNKVNTKDLESNVRKIISASSLKGEKGETGAPGASLYTWIKYATSDKGAKISDSPTGMSYMGIATNKTTPTKSNTPTDYTWSLIKGENGTSATPTTGSGGGISTVVSVKDYGAKGDGSTDDSTAIQSAFSSGLHIFFPVGKYRITKTLVIDKPSTQVSGVNSNQSFIIQSTSNIPIIRIKTSHYKVSNLNLGYATRQTAAHTRGVAIELGDADDSTGAFEGEIDHLLIYQPYRGIAIPTHTGSAYAFENTITHVRVLDAWDTSFHLNSTGIGLTTNTLMNCYALFQPNPLGTANGYFIGNHDDFVMINCACDHGKNRVLTVSSCRGGTIIDFPAEACRLTENYKSFVFVDNSVVNFTNLQIVYPIAEATEAYGLYVGGAASRVNVTNFAERDVDTKKGASTLSIVNDGLGELIVHNAKYVSPLSIKGKAKVNHNQWSASALPKIGKWNVGDVIWNSAPTSTSNLGWICITAGDFATSKTPAFRSW